MAGRKGGVKAAEKAETRVEKVFWGTTDRLGTTSFLDENIKKAFPKHWSFLLGEIALYSFIILVITGVFLTLFFSRAVRCTSTTARTRRSRA